MNDSIAWHLKLSRIMRAKERGTEKEKMDGCMKPNTRKIKTKNTLKIAA
jgi:hypothetical protein